MQYNEIVDSFKKRDNVAFQYLYLHFGDFCINQLIRKGCAKEDAEDLFVESVLVLRDKVLKAEIAALTNTKYFLFRICENRFLALKRRERTANNHQGRLELFFYESPFFDPAKDHYDDEKMTAMKLAMEKLTERCREIIRYFYFDKLNMIEISNLMNLSSADVAKTTKSRCYRQLVTIAKDSFRKIAAE